MTLDGVGGGTCDISDSRPTLSPNTIGFLVSQVGKRNFKFTQKDGSRVGW